MVPPLDNSTINTKSQSHNDNITPGQALIEILREHENIVHDIRKDQIDVNAFADDPASGTVTVSNPIRKPILITDIVATWGTSQSQSTVNVPNPGAGQLPIYTNNTGVPQTLITAEGFFTASAAVANRFIGIKVTATGGGQQIAFMQDATAVVASTTIELNAGVGYTLLNAASGNTFLPLPMGLVIPPGGTVTLTTANIDVADAWTNINLTFAASTSGTATLQFGGRTFQLNYSSGLFLATGLTHGMQMDNTTSNKITLTVVPAAAVHLEITGTADYPKVERL